MTSFLNRYTVNESRPLDQATLHILSVVNRLAGDLELPYIVVGATARDLLLFHVFGIPVNPCDCGRRLCYRGGFVGKVSMATDGIACEWSL
jgi:hypothetical protein